jgi:hypothetical protein
VGHLAYPGELVGVAHLHQKGLDAWQLGGDAQVQGNSYWQLVCQRLLLVVEDNVHWLDGC